MQALDPVLLPLKGRRLIEASAGTGKTYTLVLLVLRLIVEKRIPIDHILVVTFTRAATHELRLRIRARIREMLDILEGTFSKNRQEVQDKQLLRLLDAVDAVQARADLKDALLHMDEAAVFTIHGFCQRILQDNAFETGMVFSADFLDAEKALHLQIMADFWRNNFYDLPEEMCRWISSQWSDPGKLLATLAPTLSLFAAAVVPDISAASCDALKNKAETLHTIIQSGWPSWREEVENILYNDPGLKRSEKTYRVRDIVPAMLAFLEDFAAQDTLPYVLTKLAKRLGQSAVNNNVNRNKTAPQHPLFLHLEHFTQALDRYLKALKIRLLHQARAFFLTELDRRNKAQATLSYDDLLSGLAAALEQPQSGNRLAKLIARKFPAALIDEFQDTDPLQYHIFNRIYHSSAGTLLAMIGDPKQAIYSFRGADIFTYILARRQTPATHRYTLETNYRSSKVMVQAVNRLFSLPDNPFLFAPDITFYPVKPSPEAHALCFSIHDKSVAPLNLLLLGHDKKPLSKQKAADAAATISARKISSLLAHGDKKQALLSGLSLEAGDIAVLVRTHFEADLMQQALQHCGITSVCFNLKSVFDSAEARDMLQLLRVLTNLTDRKAVTTLLAGNLFGLNATDISLLPTDQERWNTVAERLRQYSSLWQEQGVMIMLHRLFAREKVVFRLTGRTGGERILTNYLHLAELLQEAARKYHGTAGLVRWLSQQLNDPQPDLENQQLRLENDEKLVKIVTIHKAKGLEYPIVFLPFLWDSRKLDSEQPFVFHPPDTLAATLDLGSEEKEHYQLAAKEQQAEAIRLLYVALTRARYCCFFCWGRIRGMEHSAMDRFLHSYFDQETAQPRAPINTPDPVSDREAFLEVHHPEPVHDRRVQPEKRPRSSLQVKIFTGSINPGKQITSYSHLTARQGDQLAGKTVSFTRQPLQEKTDTTYTAFEFPRGAVAGTCLHSILEQIDFMDTPEKWQPVIIRELTVAGIRQEEYPGVKKWLHAILSVPLPGAVPLKNIGRSHRLDEMPFLFPLPRFNPSKLNRVLSRYGLAPMPETKDVTGMMKGFIDLIFLYNNRYYIVDYKSNYLGSRQEDYMPLSLKNAMREHLYELQYLIYSVALHRYLTLRLPEYSYEKHFGGIYYLFLRGMHPDFEEENGIYHVLPERDCIASLDDIFREGEK
ncbi:MAG: exodeoxyribonuclease V subunit beta [Deltaproteobacteria bacterium]|nr:MAG: exodeoxyribonuclease V subunit beta [Deltaproteobacteria bacterium]